MQSDAPDPGLSSDAAEPGCGHRGCCPHCGARSGDPTDQNMAMLGELAEISMMLLRAVGRKVEATGEAGPADQEIIDSVGRTLRRTLAMHQRLYDDSRKTDKQREAESFRRIDAQVSAQGRMRRDLVRRKVEAEIAAHVARQGEPGDAERLLGDMHERLLDTDIEWATTRAEISAICLDLCKGLGIAPRDEIWSDAMMAFETHATVEAMRADAAARVPPVDLLKDRMKPPDTG
jgi:hypothetical protein